MINVGNTNLSFCTFDILVYGGVAIGYWYTLWIYTGLIILSI